MKSVHLLFVLLFSSFLFLSCSDNDDEVDSIILSSPTLKMYSHGSSSMTIVQGNGGYTVVSSDNETATASVTNNTISITGKKVGKVTITIKDKKDKTTDLVVELYEEVFSYKVIDTDIFRIEGTVSEEVREAIKEDIPLFYPAENEDFYHFIRNQDYTGILSICAPGSNDPLYEGTFIAGRNAMRLTIRENVYSYTGVKEEPKSVGGDQPAEPFPFLDNMNLIYDCTEYYKDRYPDAGTVYLKQYIQRVYPQ